MAITVLMGGYAFTSNQTRAAGNMSHAHMGHITTAWKGTPEGKGLLPTAMAEAKIAAQHAGFAAKKPDNLAWMQLHTHHVLHAIDASKESKGPGLGYGVLKAANGVSKHVNLAAKSSDASGNVRAHAVHVTASAENTVTRAKQIVTLGEQVIAASTAAQASELVQQMAALSNQLVAGFDDNGDGNITWQKGEGGLNAVTKHMGLMAKGEGMN